MEPSLVVETRLEGYKSTVIAVIRARHLHNYYNKQLNSTWAKVAYSIKRSDNQASIVRRTTWLTQVNRKKPGCVNTTWLIQYPFSGVARKTRGRTGILLESHLIKSRSQTQGDRHVNNPRQIIDLHIQSCLNMKYQSISEQTHDTKHQ